MQSGADLSVLECFVTCQGETVVKTELALNGQLSELPLSLPKQKIHLLLVIYINDLDENTVGMVN